MKSNEELQKNVEAAIYWEPLLQAASIGVMVKDGVVTLTGSVNTYAKKAEAGLAAKNVAGVRTVLEDIKVVCNTMDTRTDLEIMTAIENTFKWHWDIPLKKVTAVVEDCWVFLSGELEWNYQKEAAKNAISNLIGIIGITNNISVKNSSKDRIEQNDIELALERDITIYNKDIAVCVCNNVVTLKGHVDSWYQKSKAERIAWNAPGVKQVQNDLYVNFEDE